jgi:predicted secreted protein
MNCDNYGEPAKQATPEYNDENIEKLVGQIIEDMSVAEMEQILFYVYCEKYQDDEDQFCEDWKNKFEKKEG